MAHTLKVLAKLARRYRVDQGARFRLSTHDPAEVHLSGGKSEAKKLLEDGRERVRDLQERLYAQDRWSVLMVLQAMDAAGKDSTIEHVMSGVNPQGCQVVSFKQPSQEELDHDFLWRCARALPERGRIGIFNRSHYEELLVVRVHPELLQRQTLPKTLVTPKIWEQRAGDIANWESYLARNGTAIAKIFLHVSRDEQRKRFQARLDEPEKNWKFHVSDVAERAHWDAYQQAYQDAIRRTAAPHAPWYVVPADTKWFTRLVVMAALIQTLESLELQFPKIAGERKQELVRAGELLAAEKRKPRKGAR
ncbi:MAG: polyphosphate kinase 2 family protein [Planctomycetes bacterium]|nr:polyphosphate kinase 2 family protein [Planctomycetota bacterium]